MQWCMQSLSDAGIPVWGPKLGAQIKQTFDLSKTFQNVELKTLSMPGPAAQVFKCIVMYSLCKRIQHFCRTGVRKLSSGYKPVMHNYSSYF